MLILLHDDENTYVEINECPYKYTWNQERYIVDFYGHYQNQMPPIPVVQWPSWLDQAMIHLSRIVKMDRETEEQDAKNR